MNKKGQMVQMLGIFLGVFAVIVVGLAIYGGGIVPIVGQVTNTEDVVNLTVTAGAVNVTEAFKGQGFAGTVAVEQGGVDQSANFDVASRQVLNGLLTNTITTNDAGAGLVGQEINLSYTSEPEGYAGDQGSRTVTLLIAIFAALGVAVVALELAMRGMGMTGLMDRIRN